MLLIAMNLSKSETAILAFTALYTAAFAVYFIGHFNIEFIAVLTVPDDGVGGYYNTALDIVFNFVGAMLAIIGFYLFRKNTDV